MMYIYLNFTRVPLPPLFLINFPFKGRTRGTVRKFSKLAILKDVKFGEKINPLKNITIPEGQIYPNTAELRWRDDRKLVTKSSQL